MPAPTHARKCVCICTYTSPIHANMTHTCICPYTHVYTGTYTYICLHTHRYTYICLCSCINTHIHTRMRLFVLSPIRCKRTHTYIRIAGGATQAHQFSLHTCHYVRAYTYPCSLNKRTRLYTPNINAFNRFQKVPHKHIAAGSTHTYFGTQDPSFVWDTKSQ